MRTLWLGLALVSVLGCGSKQPADDGDTLPDDLSERGGDPPPPPRTELQTRQAAACEQLGPRITECAIADARAQLPPEELAKLDLDKTAPLHTREFIKQCTTGTMSSRQVRVYEVCDAEETECGALLACLENASPDHATDGEAPAAPE